MAFRFLSFDGIPLPLYNWTADHGTPNTSPPAVETANGTLDYFGSRRRIQHSQIFEVQGVVNTGNPQAAVQALKKSVGRTGYLIRSNPDGTVPLRRFCRVINVSFPSRATQRGIVNLLSVRFWTNEPFWESATAVTHGPTVLPIGYSNPAYTILGQEDVLDPIITITATATITNLLLEHGKLDSGEDILSSISYTGPITAGQSLVIDCGRYTVKLNGVPAMTYFSLNLTHTENYFIRMIPGPNDFDLNLTGGAGTLQIQYNPQYQ